MSTSTSTSPSESVVQAPSAAVATRRGTDGPLADAAAVYVTAEGAVAAAVVDGIGHAPSTVALAPVLAEVAARAGAARGPLAGLLTAALLVEDPGPDDEDSPDAVAVAALRSPGGLTVVAWAGDCRAYAWDGQRLRQYSNDHTVGAQLALNGAPWALAEEHDNWIRVTLARASVSTVYTVLVPTNDLLVLTSDGVHDQVQPDVLEHLVRRHHADPQTLADMLVAAAEADSEGYRDDATAVVVTATP